MTDDRFSYDLFLSYARTPDALVAREVQRLREAFHESMRQGGGPGVAGLGEHLTSITEHGLEVAEQLRACLAGARTAPAP